ncbi:MAG: isoamylase early set domain-containing protein [Gemmatimonadota bacterium]|nr:isoamylase early set domain-containing protein [Gemmatimonadota bacterium]
MSDEQDLMIERVRTTLRESPDAATDARAVARVLATVWASPRPSFWRRCLDAWRMPAVSGLGAAAVAGLALLAGFVTRGSVDERAPQAPMTASGAATGEHAVPSGTPQAVQYAAAAGEGAMVPTQFVLDEPAAKSVALVGDFNDWKPEATPLTRLETGVWTVTTPLPPGRHVYAFMIDGTLVMADPRAPKSGDADYGREGSVVMVFAR